MSVKVRVTGGAKFKAWQERLKQSADKVFVGVLEGTPPADNGTPMAVVAAVNNFGSDDGLIPARNFMEEGMARAGKRIARQAQKDLREVVHGRMTFRATLQRIGKATVGYIREAIFHGSEWAEPNAPSTIARKGFDRPLYETGRQLANAINYEVRP